MAHKKLDAAAFDTLSTEDKAKLAAQEWPMFGALMLLEDPLYLNKYGSAHVGKAYAHPEFVTDFWEAVKDNPPAGSNVVVKKLGMALLAQSTTAKQRELIAKFAPMSEADVPTVRAWFQQETCERTQKQLTRRLAKLGTVDNLTPEGVKDLLDRTLHAATVNHKLIEDLRATYPALCPTVIDPMIAQHNDRNPHRAIDIPLPNDPATQRREAIKAWIRNGMIGQSPITTAYTRDWVLGAQAAMRDKEVFEIGFKRTQHGLDSLETYKIHAANGIVLALRAWFLQDAEIFTFDLGDGSLGFEVLAQLNARANKWETWEIEHQCWQPRDVVAKHLPAAARAALRADITFIPDFANNAMLETDGKTLKVSALGDHGYELLHTFDGTAPAAKALLPEIFR